MPVKDHWPTGIENWHDDPHYSNGVRVLGTSGLVVMSNLDQVAARMVEHCGGRWSQLKRLLSELHSVGSHSLEFPVNIGNRK